jgi:tetratricopeptide (TPR) repeat protein
MMKNSSVQKKLQKILSTREYGELKGYEAPETWTPMSTHERELLGSLFVMHGQDLLKRGDKSALRCFDLAAKVAPNSPKVFFDKGVAYSSQQKNIRCLMSASRSFAKATKLNPVFFEAWSEWGRTLLLLGELKSDYLILQSGVEKFEMGASLIESAEPEHIPEFYWHWGHCWYNLGKLSGEAVDIASALKMYTIAKENGLDRAEFWNDYGNALAEQACLVGRDEIFTEVVELYLKAIDLNPEDFEAWLNLACCYSRIYEFECDDAFFTKAHEAFEHASELYTKNISLWMCWGQLLLHSGKVSKDMEKLHESIDKFQEACACEPNHPLVLCRLAEA